MHVWRVRKVVESLRAGLSEQEQTRYFLAFFLLIVLDLNLPIDSDARGWLGRYGFLKWLVYSVIAITGAVTAYRANRSGDGHSFVARFIALSVPLTVQSLCLVVLGLIGVSLIPDRLSQSNQSALASSSFWEWFWFGLRAFVEGLLFVRLAVNMKRVSVNHGVT